MYREKIDALKEEIRNGQFAEKLAAKEDGNEAAFYAISGLMVMSTMELSDETAREAIYAIVQNISLNIGKMLAIIMLFADPKSFENRKARCKELFPEKRECLVREENSLDDLKSLDDGDALFLLPCVANAHEIRKDFFAELVCKVYRSGVLPKAFILNAMITSCYTWQEHEKMCRADKIQSLAELFGEVVLSTKNPFAKDEEEADGNPEDDLEEDLDGEEAASEEGAETDSWS